jgi:hypothetical protein
MDRSKFLKTVSLGMLGGGVGFLTACDNNFLSVTPKSAITSNAVWENANLVQAYVNEIYAAMWTEFDHDPRMSTLSDNAHERARDSNRNIVTGGMAPNQFSAIDFWGDLWQLVKRCNTVIGHLTGDAGKKLKSQEGNKTKIERMLGEAKFLRAYFYQRLLALYGGVPIIKKEFSLSDKDILRKRDSYADVAKFIISELDTAADVLPATYSQDEKGRATKGAALAIKSRALLFMASPWVNNDESYMSTSHPELIGFTSYDQSRWKEARDAAKAVIDLGIYSLYPDYRKLFTTHFNNEFIFYKNFNNEKDQQTRVEVIYWPNGSGGYAQVNPIQSLVDAYETKNGLLPKDDPSYDFQDPYKNRDPRLDNTILHNGSILKGRKMETYIPGGTDSSDGPQGWNASESGYYVRKFTDESIKTPPTAHIPSSPQWPYIRYGEILLNYAEASYHLGDENTAREYINKIRSRPSVQMPPITDSGPELLKRIQNERRVELALEAQRWFDVRRWKIAPVTGNFEEKRMAPTIDASGKVTYKLEPVVQRKFHPKDYLVPIPADEIKKDPKLIQNPGYVT